MSMSRFRVVAAALLAASAAACDKAPPPVPAARPVQAVTIEGGAAGETVSLTGQLRAKDEVNLAFRLDGRMIERPVHVGDRLAAGQAVAKLEPQTQQNSLRSAQANVAAAEAAQTQARLTFGRQQELLAGGWTPRARFDEAQQALRSADAQLQSAEAQLRIAQDQLGYTVLAADAAGTVTAVGAEPGEVIRAGQMVVQLARQGGLDAVFDVSEQIIRTGPRDPAVQIVLTDDPTVKATGRIREVSPQADAATRTFRVKVAIADPPEAMRLGSTVTGSIQLASPPGIEIPASALTEANGHPAVWLVDPHSQVVSLRPVEVLRYDPAGAVISNGLETGETVVTAGVQTLVPGQKVRLLGASS